MNFRIQPKNGTEELVLSITKNCQTLIEQTNKKAEETLEFKQPNQERHFTSTHQLKVKRIG